MKKNIVFISIFDLTRAMYEVSKAMAARGHSICWITTNPHWTNWLRKQNVPESTILELVYDKKDFIGEDEKADLQRQIVACEANVDLSVNQCLMMDQFVMYRNKKDINEYIYLYYRDIKRFFVKNKVTHVFAEPTNINEIMAYMICRELGIKYFAPWDMRYPRNRIIFIDGYLQSPFISSKNGSNPRSGEPLLQSFREHQTTPAYFEKHNNARIVSPRQLLSSSLNRLRRKQVANQNHLTHHHLGERVARLTRRLVNSFYLKNICSYDNLDRITGRIAFFGLHVQPEASIDVRGSFFSDQLKLVKDIRRSLPFDVTLVLKEHPNFLGGRGYAFFKELRKIPNVKIVRHDVSTFALYDVADIVFTVSGTTAYEAGMLGIPAVTFSPMFFGGLSSVHHCSDITRLKPLVFDLLDGFKRDYKEDCRFMSELVNKSYEGYWTNPLLDPSIMESDNIRKVSNAFIEVLESDPA